MSDSVNRFYNSISDVRNLTQNALIEMFVYYITVELSEEIAIPKKINSCFEACDLHPPKNTAARLSDGVSKKTPIYIKVKNGYKLHRHAREAISKKLGVEVMVAQTSSILRGLEHEINNIDSKKFLAEALDCFEVGANRATIVLVWILTVDHLQLYILKHKLSGFNMVLSANTDKRIKIKSVNQLDDFNEISESKFIEFCRSAKIISNDVRKILDQKLQIRNSSAHPSGVTVGKVKVIDFVEDLINNVVLKFKI